MSKSENKKRSVLCRTAIVAAAFSLAAAPLSAQEPAAPLEGLDASSFNDKVLNAELPVLVEFGAAWCGWCKLQKPLLERTPAHVAGALDVYSLDVEENAPLAKKYGVDGVPVLAIFYNGQMISRQTGYLNARALGAWIGKTVKVEYRQPSPRQP